MSDAFRESDAMVFRNTVTFVTGFGVIADQPFNIGSPTSTNSVLNAYNQINPYGGISGYVPNYPASPLGIYMSGWYNPTLYAYPILEINTTVTGNNLGSLNAIFGDLNSASIQVISYNNNLNGVSDTILFNATNFSAASPLYPDGLMGYFADSRKLAWVGDYGQDQNSTYISVDDDNGLFIINAGTTIVSSILSDTNSKHFLDPYNRLLVNTGGNNVLDWQNKTLSGNWNSQGLQVSGANVATVSSWSSLTWGTGTNWIAVSNTVEDKKILLLTGDTILNISNLYNGWNGVLEIIQSGISSSGYSLILPLGTKVMNSGNGLASLTMQSGAIDVLGFSYNGSRLLMNIGNQFN